MKKKNFDWAVIVTCQGQPFYYKFNTLAGALAGYVWEYLTNRRYGTMNFTLKQVFHGSDVKWEKRLL